MLLKYLYPTNRLGDARLPWVPELSLYAIRSLERLLSLLAAGVKAQFFIAPDQRYIEHHKDLWPVLPVVQILEQQKIINTFKEQRRFYPDEPQGHTVRTTITGKGGVGYSGSGNSMTDRTKAAWASVGEALERWALSNYYPRHYQDTSYKKLTGKKLDICSIPNVADSQTVTANGEYEFTYDENSSFRWFRVTELTTEQPALVPLQLFSFSRCYEISRIFGEESEPLIAPIISSGAASGVSLTDARLRGLFEVIERDAFMLYWLTKKAPQRIDIATIPDDDIPHLLTTAERYQLDVTLLHLETDIPVHTVLCIVTDQTAIGPQVYVDAKTGYDLRQIAVDLVSQSLANRQNTRRFMDVYGSEYDASKKLDHRQRLLKWFQEGGRDDIDFLLRGTEVSFDRATVYPAATLPKAEQLETLLGYFRDHAYEVYSQEVIPQRLVRQLGGMTTAVTRVPQLQPVYLDETLRCVSPARIAAFRKHHTLSEAPLNQAAHPFI